MTCNSTAVYKSFVNKTAFFFQATIDNLSFCYMFQALHRYFKRFHTTNIRREIIFSFLNILLWSRVHAMHLRRSASMRLDCINTHKLSFKRSNISGHNQALKC